MSTEGKPADTGASNAAVLFVSDAEDADLRRFIDVLIEQGIRVDHVRDVYTAAAMLATGCRAAKLLVDIRTLDDKEMLFLRLARRFYPAAGVLVPQLPGADQRQSAAAAYGVRTVGPDELAESFTTLVAQVPPSNEGRHEPPPPRSETRGASEAASTRATPTKTATECPATGDGPTCAAGATSEAGAAEEEQMRDEDLAAISENGSAEPPPASDVAVRQAESPPQPSPPVAPLAASPQPPASSVETDSTAGPSGPSLHEAVRQRMAADGPTAARRPPSRRPPDGGADRLAGTDGGLQARPFSDAGIPPAESRPSVEPSPGPASQARRVGTLGRAMLSPEEMDALLREELPSDAAGASPPSEQAAESGPDAGEVS